MKLSTYTLKDLEITLSDPDSELYGGALSYLLINFSLALFIKILRRKARKPGDRLHTYQTLINLSQSVMDQAKIDCELDGKVFADIMNKNLRDRDTYIENVTTKQISMVSNLSTIQGFLSMLLQETKNSLKADFQMIQSILHTAKDNIVSIIKFEVNRMDDELRRAVLEGEITKL